MTKVLAEKFREAVTSTTEFRGEHSVTVKPESLKPLLAKLPPRERQIIMLRFFANMTQSQIGEEVGISQMHVSRLLTRTLAQLRQGLIGE